MKIGELATAAGTTTKALRFYEQAGLLKAPDRTPAGYRNYSADTVARLEFIRRSQSAGLTWARSGTSSTSATPGRPPAITYSNCSRSGWSASTGRSRT